ncbi:MAG: FkbM family methyltransferase [Solirubrobacteraceae bacterium]
MGRYLRPAKWHNAVRRRKFAAVAPRLVKLRRDCPTEYLGTSYGGWAVPTQIIDSESVAYSIGAGGDISFDIELIRRTGCRVLSFDPAVAARMHEAAGCPRHSFYNFAIWHVPGELEMFVAQNPEHMALSAANLQRTHESVLVPCRTIESVRAEHGHDRIDLIKITIDGAEYDFVPHLDLAAWQTKVVVLAVHHNRPLRAVRRLFSHMAEAGFAPVARKPPAGFTWVRDEAIRGERPPVALSRNAPMRRKAAVKSAPDERRLGLGAPHAPAEDQGGARTPSV